MQFQVHIQDTSFSCYKTNFKNILKTQFFEYFCFIYCPTLQRLNSQFEKSIEQHLIKKKKN